MLSRVFSLTPINPARRDFRISEKQGKKGKKGFSLSFNSSPYVHCSNVMSDGMDELGNPCEEWSGGGRRRKARNQFLSTDSKTFRSFFAFSAWERRVGGVVCVRMIKNRKRHRKIYILVTSPGSEKRAAIDACEPLAKLSRSWSDPSPFLKSLPLYKPKMWYNTIGLSNRQQNKIQDSVRNWPPSLWVPDDN